MVIDIIPAIYVKVSPVFYPITTYLVNIYFRKQNSAGKETPCVEHWKYCNREMFEGKN